MLSGGVSAADYRALLRNRSFRNLTLATVTSALGDWIGVLAIIALTTDILGPTRAAAFAVSGVMAVRLIPALVLSPVAGVFVDRWNRKRVLIATDVGRGTVMALIPFTNEIFTLLLATLVIELLSSLFAPAKDAVFPRLVERTQLVAANQVNLLVTYGTLPLGGVLFAGLVGLANTLTTAPTVGGARWPLALPIWFNALSFFVSAPLLARLRIPDEARRGLAVETIQQPGAWEQLKEGLRFVAGHPVIRALIVGVMITFVAAGAVISVGELFATVLNAGPSGFGILIALVGSGLVAGLMVAGPLTGRVDKERLFAPGIGVAGIMLAATALMPTLTMAAPLIALVGLGAGISFIVGYTILQERSGDEIRGRTFAAFYTGVRTAILGATVAAPALVGVIGPERRRPQDLGDLGEIMFTPYVLGGVRITLLLSGVLMVVGSAWTWRAFRRALADDARLALQDDAAEPAVRHGTFIVFEGGDGAGKSTHIRLLRSAIERAGYDAVVTREPGGTPLGERIRDLLLVPTGEEVDDRAEALLYAAARAQHVREVIRPALEKGAVVLCDRFVDSSVVYQGVARGLGPDQIVQLNRWATEALRPDLIVLLDVDPAEGLARAGGEPDRMESAGLEFHKRVNEAYRRRAEQDPDRYLVLDASQPVEEVHRLIRTRVERLLGEDRVPGGENL